MWVLLFKTDCIPCFQGKLICTTKHRLYPLTTEKSKGSKGGDKECSSLLNESLTNLILTMSPKMHFTSQYQQGDFFLLLLLPLKKFLTSVIQDSHSNKNQESSLRLWAISCNTSLLTAAFQHCLPSATERPTSNTEVTISCCCYLWKPQKQKHCSSHRGKKRDKRRQRERENRMKTSALLVKKLLRYAHTCGTTSWRKVTTLSIYDCSLENRRRIFHYYWSRSG